MGRLHLRKNNIGKAIIRFLIGLLILAILVWLLYEFVLTGEFNPSSRMDNALPLNGTQPAQTTVVSGTTAAIPLPVDTLSPAEPTATPETTAAAEPTEEPTAEPVSQPAERSTGIVNMAEEGKTLYAAQLDRYAAALSEQWPEGRYFENGMSEIAGYYYEGDARANVGVFFPDLDGDGSPEMVIGAILGADTDPAVLEIWTVKDGAPVMLAQSHARDKYYVEYLADENAWLIANEGSGGAASSVWFYYGLRNGELALMQGVTSESGAWYMTYDTDCDVSNDTPSDEAVCQAIIDSHTERYTALDYTPYTELRQ